MGELVVVWVFLAFEDGVTAFRAVFLGLFHGLRASVSFPDDFLTAGADEDVFPCREFRATWFGIEVAGPAFESGSVIRRPVFLHLLDMDEFVTNRPFPLGF